MTQESSASGFFASDLIHWYQQSKRQLPWRQTRDPYKILVSELMLQQTQVKTVIPFYLRFLESFPDIRSLALASEELLLKKWQGLGYYRRARNLQKAARQIQDRHDGIFPKDKQEIEALAGVGTYTSAAVASIAFDLPYACVDGNVIRVISRLDALDGDVDSTSVKKQIQQRAQELLDPHQAGDYNQAMMELGATVCTPRNPSCLTCPVKAFCKSLQSGQDPQNRPVKSKKVVVSRVRFETLFLFSGDRVLLANRPEEGLMAGMWELPSIQQESLPDFSWTDLLRGPLQFLGTLAKPITHRFTHLHASYFISVYKCEDPVTWLKPPDLYRETRWVDQQQLAHLPLTNVLFKTLPHLTQFMKEGLPCQPQVSTLPGMPATS